MAAALKEIIVLPMCSPITAIPTAATTRSVAFPTPFLRGKAINRKMYVTGNLQNFSYTYYAVHGLWYIYRQYLSSDDTNTLNNIFGVYGLNATAVPLTNIFAENQWLPSSYYSSTDGGNTYTCQYDHWIGSVGRDGSQIGIDYNSETNPAYAPNPQSTMAIKYDYRKYSIDYGCSSPNLKTGICASPIVYVSTRVRPTQLSYHEKMETDRVVDAVFAPYCRSADDIPLQQYDDNKPDCSLPLQPQDCANSTLQVMGIDTDIFVGLTRVEIPTAFGRF
ncbi:uncharacterized protein LOC129600057 isoform X2 [Paramacrobiotus metropolitanus]|uniref:uncharacterized protein LOC129600057 isoform X2 n=1 Tax=Paramacrobiotus metropolitanus TaxID=2943436 RepID=UPI002445F641|nr:uncharacterized protein LOC129600057 isoform X2 [Paramacrobiotus metropolitanus]